MTMQLGKAGIDLGIPLVLLLRGHAVAAVLHRPLKQLLGHGLGAA